MRILTVVLVAVSYGNESVESEPTGAEFAWRADPGDLTTEDLTDEAIRGTEVIAQS